MARAPYRIGVNPGYLVKRTLHYQPQSAQSFQSLLQQLDAMPGMQSVVLKIQPPQLRLAYDASRLQIDHLLEMLHAAGMALKTGWLAQRKLSHYRFVDQNVLNNARHVPVCCNKPPPEVARRLRQ